MRDVHSRLNALYTKAKLPQTERELLGIERRFKLNDYIYSYLLTAQSGSKINKGFKHTDNEIIDHAQRKINAQ